MGMLIPLEAAIELSYRLFEDGVRRRRDLDLAEWLGLVEAYSIRDTITRNRAELKRHGILLARQAETSSIGGRPGTETWLNFEQAMVVCTLSRTAQAEDAAARPVFRVGGSPPAANGVSAPDFREVAPVV